jgi:hypothetical protein
LTLFGKGASVEPCREPGAPRRRGMRRGLQPLTAASPGSRLSSTQTRFHYLPLMRCEECGAEAEEQARGWRALIGEEDDGEVVVCVFCAECAAREFGASERPSRGAGSGG